MERSLEAERSRVWSYLLRLNPNRLSPSYRLGSNNANAAAIATEAVAVGAFALPSGSADCALLLTLPPGAYTAVVTGAGNTGGVALVEAYQAP
jgi:hypothetical protein